MSSIPQDAAFLKFRHAPEHEQLAQIKTFSPKKAVEYANLYSGSHTREDPITIIVWAKLLERSKPNLYRDGRQDGDERDRVDAAHVAAHTSREAVLEFLATCDEPLTAERDCHAEDAELDRLDSTGDAP